MDKVNNLNFPARNCYQCLHFRLTKWSLPVVRFGFLRPWEQAKIWLREKIVWIHAARPKGQPEIHGDWSPVAKVVVISPETLWSCPANSTGTNHNPINVNFRFGLCYLDFRSTIMWFSKASSQEGLSSAVLVRSVPGFIWESYNMSSHQNSLKNVFLAYLTPLPEPTN